MNGTTVSAPALDEHDVTGNGSSGDYSSPEAGFVSKDASVVDPSIVAVDQPGTDIPLYGPPSAVRSSLGYALLGVSHFSLYNGVVAPGHTEWLAEHSASTLFIRVSFECHCNSRGKLAQLDVSPVKCMNSLLSCARNSLRVFTEFEFPQDRCKLPTAMHRVNVSLAHLTCRWTSARRDQRWREDVPVAY